MLENVVRCTRQSAKAHVRTYFVAENKQQKTGEYYGKIFRNGWLPW